MLRPINGYVLVELLEQYKYAATPEVQYATKTSGYVRKVWDDTHKANSLLNRRVWFKSYEDDVKIEQEDKTYTFIKFRDIKGYEDDEN